MKPVSYPIYIEGNLSNTSIYKLSKCLFLYSFGNLNIVFKLKHSDETFICGKYAYFCSTYQHFNLVMHHTKYLPKQYRSKFGYYSETASPTGMQQITLCKKVSYVSINSVDNDNPPNFQVMIQKHNRLMSFSIYICVLSICDTMTLIIGKHILSFLLIHSTFVQC